MLCCFVRLSVRFVCMWLVGNYGETHNDICLHPDPFGKHERNSFVSVSSCLTAVAY